MKSTVYVCLYGELMNGLLLSKTNGVLVRVWSVWERHKSRRIVDFKCNPLKKWLCCPVWNSSCVCAPNMCLSASENKLIRSYSREFDRFKNKRGVYTWRLRFNVTQLISKYDLAYSLRALYFLSMDYVKQRRKKFFERIHAYKDKQISLVILFLPVLPAIKKNLPSLYWIIVLRLILILYLVKHRNKWQDILIYDGHVGICEPKVCRCTESALCLYLKQMFVGGFLLVLSALPRLMWSYINCTFVWLDGSDWLAQNSRQRRQNRSCCVHFNHKNST